MLQKSKMLIIKAARLELENLGRYQLYRTWQFAESITSSTQHEKRGPRPKRGVLLRNRVGLEKVRRVSRIRRPTEFQEGC